MAPVGNNVPYKDDPRYASYYKMVRLGVPAEAVRKKMESDGVNPQILE